MNDFKNDLIKAFSFLETYGFTCIEGSDSIVVFESSLVELRALYDRRRSYEVGVTIRLKQDAHGCADFHLAEIYREANVPPPHNRSFFQTPDCDDAVRFLCDTARVLNEFAQPMLRGESEPFERMRASQARAAADYTTSTNLAVDRRSAEEAWRTKDFTKYSRLMQPYQERLSHADKRKLDYALTQIKRQQH